MRLAATNPQSFACPRAALRDLAFPAIVGVLVDLLAFNFSLMPPRRIALEMFERARALWSHFRKFNTENTEKNHRVHRGPNGEKKRKDNR